MWTRYMHCSIQHSRKSRKQVKQGEGDKVEDHVGALPRSVPPNLPHPQACRVAPSAWASWFQQFGKIWRGWEKRTSSLGSFAQWNSIHKKYLSWTLTWEAGRGGGRSKKPLGLHFDNLKICQAFRLSSYPNTHKQDEVWKVEQDLNLMGQSLFSDSITLNSIFSSERWHRAENWSSAIEIESQEGKKAARHRGKRK